MTPSRPTISSAYVEPAAWSVVKHALQAAFVASVVLLVLTAKSSPMLALAWAATGLVLMGIMATTDHLAFVEHDVPAEPVIESIVAPVSHVDVPSMHVAHPQFPWLVASDGGSLVPLVQHMQSAGVMPEQMHVT